MCVFILLVVRSVRPLGKLDRVCATWFCPEWDWPSGNTIGPYWRSQGGLAPGKVEVRQARHGQDGLPGSVWVRRQWVWRSWGSANLGTGTSDTAAAPDRLVAGCERDKVTGATLFVPAVPKQIVSGVALIG